MINLHKMYSNVQTTNCINYADFPYQPYVPQYSASGLLEESFNASSTSLNYSSDSYASWYNSYYANNFVSTNNSVYSSPSLASSSFSNQSSSPYNNSYIYNSYYADHTNSASPVPSLDKSANEQHHTNSFSLVQPTNSNSEYSLISPQTYVPADNKIKVYLINL